ncbi:hypothetical protein EDD15DRAFT_2421273 [Pisolithus albus]|nr:hypothetical protein EDD15DRAFT_2421273 [Pisolithus albus]
MSSAAKLNYTIPPVDGSRAFTQLYPGSVRPRNWREEPRIVEIEDIRGKEGDYSLDVAGFQEKIKEEYYPESVELIKKFTGATRVVIFDHTLRRRHPGENGADPKNRQPVTQVHADQDYGSLHCPRPQAPSRQRCTCSFFAVVSRLLILWRPISHPAVDWPLAVCDFRSLDTNTDLVPITLKFPDREGESAMDPEDFVLLKWSANCCYLVPHTGFEDPKTPKDAPFRESMN